MTNRSLVISQSRCTVTLNRNFRLERKFKSHQFLIENDWRNWSFRIKIVEANSLFNLPLLQFQYPAETICIESSSGCLHSRNNRKQRADRFSPSTADEKVFSMQMSRLMKAERLNWRKTILKLLKPFVVNANCVFERGFPSMKTFLNFIGWREWILLLPLVSTNSVLVNNSRS